MGKKTYWHLEKNKRIPSAYEIATSRLLYYPAKGFEVETPAGKWHQQVQTNSVLLVNDWEAFADPRATTYAKYTQVQAQKTMHIEKLLQSMGETSYQESLEPEWVTQLRDIFLPLIYPLHGMQMCSAYFGHLAPSGKIVVAALFQSADQMRKIQCVAARLALLEKLRPNYLDGGKEKWQHEPGWQPLRKITEQLLTSYDWGESFTACNLCFLPMMDELFFQFGAQQARKRGDPLFSELLQSLLEDSHWQQQWGAVLLQLIANEEANNFAALSLWIHKWLPRVWNALLALQPVWGESFPRPEKILAIWEKYYKSTFLRDFDFSQIGAPMYAAFKNLRKD